MTMSRMYKSQSLVSNIVRAYSHTHREGEGKRKEGRKERNEIVITRTLVWNELGVVGGTRLYPQLGLSVKASNE